MPSLPLVGSSEDDRDLSALLDENDRLSNIVSRQLYVINRFKSVYFLISSLVLHLVVYFQSVQSDWAGWLQPYVAALALPSIAVTWILGLLGTVLPGMLGEMDARKRAADALALTRPLEEGLRTLSEKGNTADRERFEELIAKVHTATADLPTPPSHRRTTFAAYFDLAWRAYTVSGVLTEKVRVANFEINVARLTRDEILAKHQNVGVGYEMLPGVA